MSRDLLVRSLQSPKLTITTRRALAKKQHDDRWVLPIGQEEYGEWKNDGHDRGAHVCQTNANAAKVGRVDFDGVGAEQNQDAFHAIAFQEKEHADNYLVVIEAVCCEEYND